jgi:hypothetical protein
MTCGQRPRKQRLPLLHIQDSIPFHIIPQAKHACLQGHFCAAVQYDMRATPAQATLAALAHARDYVILYHRIFLCQFLVFCQRMVYNGKRYLLQRSFRL